MLDANLQTQLKAYLEKVTQPFEIVASLDDGEKSQELLGLLKDIVGLTDQQRDEVRAAMNPNGVLLIPSFAVERAQELISDLSRLIADGELPRIPTTSTAWMFRKSGDRSRTCSIITMTKKIRVGR